MEKRNLHENWRMRRTDQNEWYPAIVPGTVYHDLLANGLMEDPYWKDNEDRACALMEYDYEYVCTFSEPEARDCTSVWLRFDGLDSVAEVFLNGQLLGKPRNMHRIWEYEVGHLLYTAQENELRVVLRSPLAHIAQEHEKYGTHGNEDCYDGFMHLRKAHYMFGWDWGAHLPDAGIFREVSLYKAHGGRITDVHILQNHENGACRLDIQTEYELESLMEVELSEDGAAFDGSETAETLPLARVRVTSPSGQTWETYLSEDGSASLVIGEPELWWVNGLGAQPLYDVEVKLFYAVSCGDGTWEETEIDAWRRRIGLRSMTVRREKDAWGESFAYELNGKTFFAMGANYIPEDHILGRRSRERTRRLLEDCKRANFNLIRVWGGGLYPDDWFYEICDELGLAVWQDFMFACSVYELTPEFEENIRQEFIDNVKRVRHHACLAMWCGNNEMEMFVKERCWVTKHSEVRDYLLMYERILPELLSEYDPQTYYWPASPSSGGSFDDPNDPNRGDVHYWKVWHGDRPFSAYRQFFFRYASEFGFQAFPSKRTIETFTDDPADWNIFSYVMEKHQRNYAANGKIMNYMQQTYRYPLTFETLIYASQLLQADAIRYGVEHFRRNRGRCMGATYWQLNDCWPVISWSSIDYCGRWKALHYYAARFFAPVMISCEEQGWMTQEANMNRQHFIFEKSIRLNVANETLKEQRVLVKWYLRNAKGEALTSREREVCVPAQTSVWLEKELLPDVDVFSQYVSYEAWIAGERVSEGTVIFSYPKYFRYEDPQLEVKTEGRFLTVTAGAYAKSVEIQNETEDLLLSDNYFDLNADSRTVEILRGEPKNLRVRSVYEIGQSR